MNPAASKSEPASQLTLVDVLITVAVGIVVAIGLDRPGAPTRADPAPRTASPPASSVHASPAGADNWGVPAPSSSLVGGLAGAARLTVTAAMPAALEADPVLAGLRDELSRADVAALAGRVAPGPATFEVWDLAERSDPLLGDAVAATVLFDGLLAAVDTAPQVAGWFHYEDPAPDGQSPMRILGVVTCCWRRDGVDEAAPAGWLLEAGGTAATLRQWVWLGGPGDGATVPDLVRAWAASGAWDPEPGTADPRIHFTALVSTGEPPARSTGARAE